MNASSDQIPEPARTAWLRLRDGLHEILGDDLVAMWAHGGTVASARPRQADLDTYVVLARPPDATTSRSIEALEEAIEADVGLEWDNWYITADEATQPGPPTHAFRDDRIDQSWAIQRAHWLAGRYWSLHGAPPDGMVPTPTSAEIAADLGEELAHLERHVTAGDYSDPYDATYAILNSSRILHSLETHDVVISKREAGAWALKNLADRWHPLLRAALRYYDGEATPEDVQVLAAGMAPFVSMVRDVMSRSA